jgi:hypothetical protein
VRIRADDAVGRENLARFLIRAPVHEQDPPRRRRRDLMQRVSLSCGPQVVEERPRRFVVEHALPIQGQLSERLPCGGTKG